MQPILIIEDDPIQLSLYSVMLRHYQLLFASDGGQALGILQNETPSLILLDMGLPGVNGHEILHIIRSDMRLAATKVIIITASLIRVAESDKPLANKILLKPFFKQQLEAAIQEALG